MHAHSEPNARPTVVGVDIGKDTFHLVAFTAGGEVAFRKKIRKLGDIGSDAARLVAREPVGVSPNEHSGPVVDPKNGEARRGLDLERIVALDNAPGGFKSFRHGCELDGRQSPS